MVKLLQDITNEQYENIINKVFSYVIDFNEEYKSSNNHTDFERGQHLAYYTMIDTIKNQLIVDNVKLDTDIEKFVDELL